MTGLLLALKEVLPILQECAPSILSILMSNYGGVAISLLGKAFGCNSDNPNELCKTILGDPSSRDVLKSLDEQHSGWIDQILNLPKLSKAELNVKLEFNQ